ncbi:MAG: transcription factor that binds to CRE motif [Sporothrix epigloea]
METFCEKPLLPSASRQIKIETSPADSLLSDPSEVYPSLFSGSSVASSAAATPTDTGDDEIIDFNLDTSAFEGSIVPSAREALGDSKLLSLAEQETTTDKKATKKRKSWGQVLPEPKTNLPPRKRAKTEDEKEQRRVERVLRNRRAAQSSRERKRQEVEALEIRNRELEEQLAKVRRENSMLYEQLTRVQGKSAVASDMKAPVTLSQELFKPQNGCLFTTEAECSLGPLLSSTTINPVSLSPALHPIPDTSEHSPTINTTVDKQKLIVRDHFAKTSQQIQGDLFLEEKQDQLLLSEPVAVTAPDSSVTAELVISPDTTHRPAVTLCPDLQCLSGELSQACVLSATESDSFALECGYLDSPDSGNSEYNYLVDNDTLAAIDGSEFNIDEFIDADVSNQPSGCDFLFDDCCSLTARSAFHNSAAQITSEDLDLQPHAGASY